MSNTQNITVDPAVQPDDEDKIFILHDQFVTTLAGNKIPVPKCSFGKDKKISHLLRDLLSGVVDSGVLTGGDGEDGRQMLAKILAVVMETAPDKAAEAMAILLEKKNADGTYDTQWIEDNLETEEVLKLLLPFFAARRDSLKKTLGPYLDLFRQAMLTQSQ